MEERKKATKAIILARVSTKDQEDGYSIDAQKYRLQEYCERKNLEILKIFEFSESSTTGERKKFTEAIDFATKQKEIIAIVVDKVDKLQRSYKETPLLNNLVEKEKIELHFCTENCIIHRCSTSQEKMMWNMFVMMAQSYVDSLRDNVNRSIAQKLREGECISAAPIGYINKRTGNGNGGNKRDKATVIIDEERAPLIKKLFEEYATGAYTIPHLREKTIEWGLRNPRSSNSCLSRSYIHELLQNPFYYGVMRVKKTSKEYPHIYPPIISKELFDQCQNVLNGWNKKPFKWGGKEFIFRGLIKCAVTGKMVTSFTKQKTYSNGNKGQWTYLRTYDPQNPEKMIYVKEEEVLKEIEKVFDSLYLEPSMLEQAVKIIKTSWKAEQECHKQSVKGLRAEYTKAKTRMDKLTDLFIDGDIDKKSYDEKRKELIQRREEIERGVESHNKADEKFTNLLSMLLELASRSSEMFKGSTTEQKRQLINLVLLNLELKAHTLTFTLRSPFDKFNKNAKNGEWYTLEDSNL